MGPEFNRQALEENINLKTEKVSMSRDLKAYSKDLKAAEKELDSYKQQLREYADKVKRRQAGDRVSMESCRDGAERDSFHRLEGIGNYGDLERRMCFCRASKRCAYLVHLVYGPDVEGAQVTVDL
jgi:hypothetical protein